MRSILTISFLLALTGCRAPAPSTPADLREIPVPLGLTIRPYEGVFRDYRPLEEALEALPAAVSTAKGLLQRRLGLDLDPDRSRVLILADDLEEIRLETKVVGPRMVQEIRLPSAPLAQNRVLLPDLLAEALSRASLGDPANERFPQWFSRGVPLWISGLWERRLMERILGGPLVVRDADRLVPPLDLTDRRPDPLSAALFFRFLAEEFGADRIAPLTRALGAAETPADAFRAALGTDPASLPVAFDGFRLRRISEMTDDPFLLEFASVRDRDPRERVQRLTGLARRASNPFVAAAIQELLGLSQFEAGRFDEAADTLAEVERRYALHALHPDRDRLYFALTFARRGEAGAAALRLASFLTEFPASEYTALALFELGSILLDDGRTEDARARFSEIVERFPRKPSARKALLVLAAYEEARFRYGLAADYLQRALPDPEAGAQLQTLRPKLEAPLPTEASPLVNGALLRFASDADAVRTLVEVGPAAGARLWRAARKADDRETYLAGVRVLVGWPTESARMWLARWMTIDDDVLAGSVIDALTKIGTTPDQIKMMLDLHPHDTPAANRVFEARFGRSGGVEGLLSSPDYRDRIEAAGLLAREEGAGSLDSLRELVVDPSPQVRRAAIGAVGMRPEPATTAILAGALADASSLVRLEALGALAHRRAWEPVREKALADQDPRVRLTAARRLLEEGGPRDAESVIVLLGDTDGGVSSSVEAMLKSARRADLGPALAESLRAAEQPGLAMRIVRIMGHHVGPHLGYDPEGGRAERTRVAMAFLMGWEAIER